MYQKLRGLVWKKFVKVEWKDSNIQFWNKHSHYLILIIYILSTDQLNLVYFPSFCSSFKSSSKKKQNTAVLSNFNLVKQNTSEFFKVNIIEFEEFVVDYREKSLYLTYWMHSDLSTPGPCKMRFLGTGKLRIMQGPH